MYSGCGTGLGVLELLLWLYLLDLTFLSMFLDLSDEGRPPSDAADLF